MNKTETEQLTVLLTNIHQQSKEGASFQEVMDVLQEELPKITRFIRQENPKPGLLSK